MSRRPVFLEELGKYVETLRETKGYKSQRQAALIAEQKGFTALTRNALVALEAGRTKNPEPEVLRQLAALYQVPYRDLVSRYVQERYTVPTKGVVRDDLEQPPELTSLQVVGTDKLNSGTEGALWPDRDQRTTGTPLNRGVLEGAGLDDQTIAALATVINALTGHGSDLAHTPDKSRRPRRASSPRSRRPRRKAS